MAQIGLHTEMLAEQGLETQTDVSHQGILAAAIAAGSSAAIVKLVMRNTQAGQQERAELVAAKHVECINAKQVLPVVAAGVG